MTIAPKLLHHPTFGSCELIPSLVAIKWKSPTDQETIISSLSALGLSPSKKEAKVKSGQRRDPQATSVNNSDALTWASSQKISDASLKKANEDDNIEWVGPVYRAKAADEGERSYFGINPSVLVLNAQAAAAINMMSIENTAIVDQVRTNLMKGYVVYNLPKFNAIDIVVQLRENAVLRGIPNAVSFENIPYLSPTCGGCGCGEQKTPKRQANKCAPATAPHIPNDNLFSSQWGLQRIDAPAAWPITKGDPNIVVAVLDQGVELLHPDLNLWPVSYSTITHTYNGSPVGNHGTACAGIIGARMDNNLGPAGLAPDCRVMAIATNFADTEVAEGLYFAADNGARVVSMSFGVYPSWMIWNFAIIEAALQYCHEKGLVLVAATGNENQPVSRFPATDPRTLGVGGSNKDDVRKSIGDTSSESWWGACYGSDVDVVAPCLEIPTTDRIGAAGYSGTDYDLSFNGTSSATPHVAALAGLILSLCPKLTNIKVYKIISETCDKINIPGYTYLATAGKPFGTWTKEVGYGRINVERALLSTCHCNEHCGCGSSGHCGVCLPQQDDCCESPCDPPWRRDENCIVWYEERFYRVPIGKDNHGFAAVVSVREPVIEFRITYEHRLCLLGKQHGPLLYTTTLLPGETIRLYHSERYRQITSAQQRYSVQTTFMQFLQIVHQARVSNSLAALSEQLTRSSTNNSGSEGGGFFFGLVGWGGSSSEKSSTSTSSQSELDIHFASEQFNQSVVQSSLLTHAERSIVISTFEDKETQDVTVRTLQNANECRAVTYFVRQVMELYSASTRVSDVSYRIIFQNVPDQWHSIDDLGWLPDAIKQLIANAVKLLPKIGEFVARQRPISLPTDGVVYDPELAHCCSCEPERAAAIQTRLEKEKAEAMKICLEVQEKELEVQRRKMLLAKGDLSPFESLPAPTE